MSSIYPPPAQRSTILGSFATVVVVGIVLGGLFWVLDRAFSIPDRSCEQAWLEKQQEATCTDPATYKNCEAWAYSRPQWRKAAEACAEVEK